MPEPESYLSSFESALYQALVDAKIRGVSSKERSFIRCELLLELIQARSVDLSSPGVGLDVTDDLEALERLPGRTAPSRREIFAAIEEYAAWKGPAVLDIRGSD